MDSFKIFLVDVGRQSKKEDKITTTKTNRDGANYLVAMFVFNTSTQKDVKLTPFLGFFEYKFGVNGYFIEIPGLSLKLKTTSNF